jgi:LmbE family N-acetylglucosaminyl deacetylase
MWHFPLTSVRRILCLGAHSDDIEIGAGGTLLQLVGQIPELEIYWVVFSAPGPRAEEAKKSAEDFLGIARKRVKVGSFRESYLPSEWPSIKDWFKEIKAAFNPDVVFTHYRDDRHQDHRVFSVPTNPAATAVGATQVNVRWTASTDNVGVMGYRVERSQGAGSTSYTQVATPTGASFSNTGLTGSTVYNYRLRAADAAGNLSGYSSVVTVTTGSSSLSGSPSPTGSPTQTGGLVVSWGLNEGYDSGHVAQQHSRGR